MSSKQPQEQIDTLIETISQSNNSEISNRSNRRENALEFLKTLIPYNPEHPIEISPKPQPTPSSGSNPSGALPPTTASAPPLGTPSPPPSGATSGTTKQPRGGLHTVPAIKDRIKRLDISFPDSDKLNTIQKEIKALDLEKKPLALCLLWRSFIELTVKQFCEKKGMPVLDKSKNNREKSLKDLVLDIHKLFPIKDKEPFAAFQKLSSLEGDYSITSLNNYTHRIYISPTFDMASVTIHNTAAFIQHLLSLIKQALQDSSAQ